MTTKVSLTKKEIALLIDIVSYMKGRSIYKNYPDPKKIKQMHFKLWGCLTTYAIDNFILRQRIINSPGANSSCRVYGNLWIYSRYTCYLVLHI
jgi:hypothetical protein